MIVSCEFILEELVKYLETYLIENNAHWLRLNFARIYQTRFQNKQFQKLQKWCNDIAAKYLSKVFESENFATLQENALVSFIGCDDLQMEEVKISLKITLQNCLPLIRYFQLSGDDIINKVKPGLLIRPLDCLLSLLACLLSIHNPGETIQKNSCRKSLERLNAKISYSKLTMKHMQLKIASQVDKKTEAYSIINNSYKFKLLIHGTRNSFTSESFWKICDKQTNTVVVIKIKGTDEIFGGYSPIA
ncbi:hypothetical protein C2G38_2241074 [Gigaspora rosea]|uniref:BACK domain-containing protein n=1 Tax=Gigaspora rosea TaxID=44941 RepID=A0A397VVY0_9GLOM|nr:hypothetical protein C2G38_2241074 [Gigaspora rosea]